MIEPPRRTVSSVERAAAVFKRFDVAKRHYFPNVDPSSLLGIALFAAMAGLLVQMQRMAGIPFGRYLAPPDSLQLLALGLLVFVLGLPLSFSGSRWERPGLIALFLGSLPYFAQRLGARRAASNGGPKKTPRLPQARQEAWLDDRKSAAWRRFENSLVATLLPAFVVPLLFALLCCGCAAHPAGTAAWKAGLLLQAYAAISCALICRRAEKLRRRGAIAPGRKWPLWPLAALPFGLSLPVLVAVMHRQVPDGPLVSPLFFDDQRFVARLKWELPYGRLPRLRNSKPGRTHREQVSKSILRVKTALLSLQAMTAGIFWPGRFPSLAAEFLCSLAATLVLAVGAAAANLKGRRERSLPGRAWTLFAWLATVAGASSFGYLLGSALGRAQPAYAGLHLTIAGFLGAMVMALLSVSLAGHMVSSRPALWMAAALPLGGLGFAAALSPLFLGSLEASLVVAGIAACLLDLPVGVAYRQTFLDPFRLADVRCTALPAATRRRLAAIAAALFLPFGGVANGVLALSALERERMLRGWWELRGISA